VCPPFVILSEANHVRQRVAPSVHAENRRGGNAATPSPASYENIVSREPRRPLRRPALTPSALARSRRRPPPARGCARSDPRSAADVSAMGSWIVSARATLQNQVMGNAYSRSNDAFPRSSRSRPRDIVRNIRRSDTREPVASYDSSRDDY